MQTKINMEIKVSRNFSTATLGIADEPIDYETEEEFKAKVHLLMDKIRNIASEQLSRI